MRLWDKDQPIDPTILDFTVGEDPVLDMHLILYDCQASLVHAEMLARTGILTDSEFRQIQTALQKLTDKIKKGEFSISGEEEDMHTAIESYLTRELGETGKKIHTARSRNDQVLTALRLYYKDNLQQLRENIDRLLKTLQSFIQKYGSVPLPGYTHTRKAMPSSVALWAGAFVESQQDNLILLESGWRLIDQSPLGTGSGYGLPLEVEREFTAARLNFSRIQQNPIYAQNSRGKFESTLLHIFTQFSFDFNRVGSDLIFFTQPELNFISLPAAFTTGSSIMPHKQNPDVLELLRAGHHRLVALEIEVKMIIGNLISGYHRDVQLTKKPVIEGFKIINELVRIVILLFNNLSVNEQACKQAMTPELFATEEVYRLVKQGVPFREAYRRIAHKFSPKK